MDNAQHDSRPLVIYHGNCADGFSAAWVFWKSFGDGAEYHPGVYNKPPPDVTGRVVYLVDFSYKRAVAEEMLKVAAGVTLIDHHETAIDDLKDLPKLVQYVDLYRCGAILAWDYLNPNVARPLLLGHIDDRDRWQFKLPGTREIQANVFSYDYTFETWDKLMAANQAELMSMSVAGSALERKHFKDIRELVKVCKRRMVIGEHDVPVCSLPYTMSSDAGHMMSVNELFAACYIDTAEHRVFSLRSQWGKEAQAIKVNEIAAQYGGGGHPPAAGFSVPRDHMLAIA